MLRWHYTRKTLHIDVSVISWVFLYILVLLSQERFTQDMQPHYIYSPREMTRWVRGIVEALRPLETLSVEGLVRLWAHEALRLFQDRYAFEFFSLWAILAQRRYSNLGPMDWEFFSSSDFVLFTVLISTLISVVLCPYMACCKICLAMA